MIFPYKIEHEKVNKQNHAWLVYLFIFLFLIAHVIIHIVFKNNVLDNYYRFGVSQFDFSLIKCFTYIFVHGSIFHLITNVYLFGMYGFTVERLIGSIHFIILFFLGGILSVSIHCLTLPPYRIDEPCIGASGAISAVLGCFLVMLPNSKVGNLIIIFIKPIYFNARAWIIIGVWLLIQLISGLKLQGSSEFNNVAYWAHIFGFAVGAAYGTILQLLESKKIKKWASAQSQSLSEALSSIRSGYPEKAIDILAETQETHPELRANQNFLHSLALLNSGNKDDARMSFVRCYKQAQDYGRESDQLNIYLQMIKSYAPVEIPAFIHLDFGIKAYREEQDNFAIFAFYQAINQGIEHRDEQICRALEKIYERRGDQDRVSTIKQIRSIA